MSSLISVPPLAHCILRVGIQSACTDVHVPVFFQMCSLSLGDGMPQQAPRLTTSFLWPEGVTAASTGHASAIVNFMSHWHKVAGLRATTG